MKRVLISAGGSHGDVLPFVALARKFASHGYETVFYTDPFFRDCVEDATIRCVPVRSGNYESYEALIAAVSKDTNPIRAFRHAVAEYVACTRNCYLAMKEDVIPGQTIAISHPLLFAHRLLRETDQVPCATVCLAPSLFPSTDSPPRMFPALDWFGPRPPRFLTQAVWWLTDKVLLAPWVIRPLNRYRAELGLPGVRQSFRTWIHEADCVIGLFPDWFGQPQADWPANLTLTGFPFYDNADQRPLSAQLEQFLQAGAPPVAFSAGTATVAAHDFFATSVKAARQAGVRAILLTHFAQQIPATLPENVIHVDYAPFGALLPRLGAFVHHGGIGSTSQALRAGVPQLIRPVAYDQLDNSVRALKLGVARELLVKQYTVPAVAQALTEILSDHALHDRCQQVAKRFESGIDPLESTYQAICNQLF